MKKKINKDNSLLMLEKKLENSSTEERVLNKFKFKPQIDKSLISDGKSLIGNLDSFLRKFKESTDQLVNDPKLIEEKNIENSIGGNSKKSNLVEMNLALGILDIKNINENSHEFKLAENKDNNILNNIIDYKKENVTDEYDHPLLNDELDKGILEFLTNNSKNISSRRRIRKIKKNKN